MRAEDALFRHAQTPLLCQQVGAVLLLESASVRPGDFRVAMGQRAQRVPELRRRLERPRTPWRRPCWVTDEDIDVSDRIRHVTLGRDGCPAALADVIDGFFSRPCDPFHDLWEMMLVQGLRTGRTAVVVKVHHTVGDSNAIIAMLSELFDPVAGRSPAVGGMSRRPGPPGRRRRRRNPRRGLARAVRGLWHLAAAGRAPALSDDLGNIPVHRNPRRCRLVPDGGRLAAELSRAFRRAEAAASGGGPAAPGPSPGPRRQPSFRMSCSDT
jgi:diacylglycerol O-acyltransferase / wax synthase